MAEIVRFPAGCEVLKFEAKPGRCTPALSADGWAVLVPFGPESGEPYRPLGPVADQSAAPEPPAS